MEILDAYDLTGSFRDAAELAGCSHHTVKRFVDARDSGAPPEARPRRDQLGDPFMDKIEEWVDRSKGKVRADKVHAKLVWLGYAGSERTTRRMVAQAKAAWRMGHRRVHRPWVTEPGMWLQYDFGEGPVIDGVRTILFVAWLAWSRFRVVLPIRDKTLPSVFACLDVVFRRIGGCPTYVLTDNEKTVTSEHIAGIPVRNPQLSQFARHYAVTVHTCVPADPASKGGSESSVRIAKADLVPTEVNLADAYDSFAELEQACDEFCGMVNARPHRVTRRAPADMLAEERPRLHRVAETPFTVAFGTTRRVPDNTPVVTFEHGQYSVPHELMGQTVWARVHGHGGDEQVILTHVGDDGPAEIARHRRATPGTPRLDDAHFPPRPAGALGRQPNPRTAAEAEFLALGEGARLWLTEAAQAGTARMRVKMADAVQAARLFDPADVDWALGHAAVHGRFGEHDLASILDHRRSRPQPGQHRAGEQRSLTQGTGGWAGYGTQETIR